MSKQKDSVIINGDIIPRKIDAISREPQTDVREALDEVRNVLPKDRQEFEMALQKAKRYNNGDNLWEIIQRAIDKIEELKARL